MSNPNWITRACVISLLWAATAVALPAQTLTTLLSFDITDGDGPNGFVQGSDGNFYGTTAGGGADNAGTVFKITPSGTLATLYSFDYTDGYLPEAGLVQASNGGFYGTTEGGGPSGNGTLFKITSGGNLTTIYYFCSLSGCADGRAPFGALVQATDGNLYGTTGGASGTIFRITPSGKRTTLYNFCSLSGCPDGLQPQGALTQGMDGNFYGTTYEGGSNACTDGCGTVYKITPSGTLTTLHNFDGTDGEYPYAGLVQGADGNFYGTTEYGGGAGNCALEEGCGTVFRITPTGTLTTLYNFCSESDCTDGFNPYTGLVQGTDGNLYGTAFNGGTSGYGTVFKTTPGGTLTTLTSFIEYPDGGNPQAPLFQATSGEFYGSTSTGGAHSAGTIYSLSVGLRPFVEIQPTSGAVGTAVKILGTSLTGATNVTFNGTSATFTVASHSLITTTVPVGATTGKVQVTGPKGTGVSNVPFTVRP
jgi:uncharacterized repeat protein (TIGR03803 family)